jgi:transcriptional regulator with XRE-family HTH domain
MTVGENVRSWRERRSYGQTELAKLVGMSPEGLFRIEKGQRQPRPATLRKIADVLGIDVEVLNGKGGSE